MMCRCLPSLCDTIFKNPLVVGGMLMAIGVFSLGFAFTAQYGFNLHPCVLCIYQRWPYGIVIALGALAVFMGRKNPKMAALFIFMGAVAFLVGGGIAGFHVGVEQKWWKGTESCGVPDFILNGSVEDWQAMIMNAPAVRCDEIPWSFLGLSMAAYNFVLSLFYALYAGTAAILITRKANRL